MQDDPNKYTNVLVAVDLSKYTDEIIEHALSITDGANLRLVYALDTLHFANAYTMVPAGDIESQVRAHVRDNLDQLGEKYNLSTSPHLICEGHAATEINKLAESLQADLIVVGSHGRHGIKLLLGSTANGVLHGAKCDVLSVRIGKK